MVLEIISLKNQSCKYFNVDTLASAQQLKIVTGEKIAIKIVDIWFTKESFHELHVNFRTKMDTKESKF